MAKSVLITGAGRGIGAATARRLVGDGYQVCINYLKDQQSAESLAQELQARGGRVLLCRADASLEADVARMFGEIDQAFGGVDGLVNNAGILLPQMRVEQMTAERINRIFTTNITSYFLCCKEAVKRMSTRYGGKGGAIVNVSSAASRLGSAGEYVDYAASKGAIDTLTMGLAAEVAEEGVRVNCVRPGFIYTDMHRDGGEPNRVDRLKSQLPLRRGGQPEEVAAAIAWLLSDQSSYSTGTFVDVSGGR